mmetsp:Transcript_40719/g.79896  ORF Transcript_40719/g.79896 Transcript_40719/m.79896 type:complete len:959 (-) Transcript_40719:102-2978(-)
MQQSIQSRISGLLTTTATKTPITELVVAELVETSLAGISTGWHVACFEKLGFKFSSIAELSSGIQHAHASLVQAKAVALFIITAEDVPLIPRNEAEQTLQFDIDSLFERNNLDSHLPLYLVGLRKEHQKNIQQAKDEDGSLSPLFPSLAALVEHVCELSRAGLESQDLAIKQISSHLLSQECSALWVEADTTAFQSSREEIEILAARLLAAVGYNHLLVDPGMVDIDAVRLNLVYSAEKKQEDLVSSKSNSKIFPSSKNTPADLFSSFADLFRSTNHNVYSTLRPVSSNGSQTNNFEDNALSTQPEKFRKSPAFVAMASVQYCLAQIDAEAISVPFSDAGFTRLALAVRDVQQFTRQQALALQEFLLDPSCPLLADNPKRFQEVTGANVEQLFYVCSAFNETGSLAFSFAESFSAQGRRFSSIVDLAAEMRMNFRKKQQKELEAENRAKELVNYIRQTSACSALLKNVISAPPDEWDTSIDFEAEVRTLMEDGGIEPHTLAVLQTIVVMNSRAREPSSSSVSNRHEFLVLLQTVYNSIREQRTQERASLASFLTFPASSASSSVPFPVSSLLQAFPTVFDSSREGPMFPLFGSLGEGQAPTVHPVTSAASRKKIRRQSQVELLYGEAAASATTAAGCDADEGDEVDGKAMVHLSFTQLDRLLIAGGGLTKCIRHLQALSIKGYRFETCEALLEQLTKEEGAYCVQVQGFMEWLSCKHPNGAKDLLEAPFPRWSEATTLFSLLHSEPFVPDEVHVAQSKTTENANNSKYEALHQACFNKLKQRLLSLAATLEGNTAAAAEEKLGGIVYHESRQSFHNLQEVVALVKEQQRRSAATYDLQREEILAVLVGSSIIQWDSNPEVDGKDEGQQSTPARHRVSDNFKQHMRKQFSTGDQPAGSLEEAPQNQIASVEVLDSLLQVGSTHNPTNPVAGVVEQLKLLQQTGAKFSSTGQLIKHLSGI